MNDDEWRAAIVEDLKRTIEYQDKRIESMRKILVDSLLSEDIILLDRLIHELRGAARRYQRYKGYVPEQVEMDIDTLEMIFRQSAVWKQSLYTVENYRTLEELHCKLVTYLELREHPYENCVNDFEDIMARIQRRM